MQGKDASEQEARIKSTAGIDVSKNYLDVHVLPCEQSLRVPNSGAGIRKLKRWLIQFDVALVVLEATGKWHRQTQRSLHASGFAVAVVDPFRIRMFAKAQGIFAKTDRLDARVLALFAALMAPVARPPADEALQNLAELVAARDSAVSEGTAIKNQLSAANGAFLKRQLKRRIARNADDVAAIEREITTCIEADGALARRYLILTSIPGVGPVIAATLIACLAELGCCNRRQIALLAGLAPIADDSGERKGVRIIHGGRPIVRRALYLAALSAARFNNSLKFFFQRLIGQGKPAKAAIIAVARKLVVLANTLLAENRTWQPHGPHPA
jgi:transposase